MSVPLILIPHTIRDTPYLVVLLLTLSYLLTLLIERLPITLAGYIPWIIPPYDITTNDTHDSNGWPLYV
jgi:hypothetical protein